MATPVISLITAVNYDIEVYEGDTTGLILQFFNSADNTPKSFAGGVIILQIKTAPGGTLQQEFSTTDGDITIGGGSNNEVTIKGWEDLTAGTYKYDLQITHGGETRTYLYGEVRVTQDVTE